MGGGSLTVFWSQVVPTKLLLFWGWKAQQEEVRQRELRLSPPAAQSGRLAWCLPNFVLFFFPNEKTYKCLIQELFHPQSCFKALFFYFFMQWIQTSFLKVKKKGQNEALALQIKASANHDRASHDSGGPAYCLFFSSLRIIRQRTQKLIRQCDNSDLRRVASIAPCTDCCIRGA